MYRQRLNGYLAQRVPGLFLANMFRIGYNVEALTGTFLSRTRYPLSSVPIKPVPIKTEGSGQALIIRQNTTSPIRVAMARFECADAATNTIHVAMLGNILSCTSIATNRGSSVIVSHSLPHVVMFCRMLSYCAMVCHLLSHVCTPFPMNADYGRSRHFCDDPVCPDPVWKLSLLRLREWPPPSSKRALQKRRRPPKGGTEKVDPTQRNAWKSRLSHFSLT